MQPLSAYEACLFVVESKSNWLFWWESTTSPPIHKFGFRLSSNQAFDSRIRMQPTMLVFSGKKRTCCDVKSLCHDVNLLWPLLNLHDCEQVRRDSRFREGIFKLLEIFQFSSSRISISIMGVSFCTRKSYTGIRPKHINIYKRRVEEGDFPPGFGPPNNVS